MPIKFEAVPVSAAVTTSVSNSDTHAAVAFVSGDLKTTRELFLGTPPQTTFSLDADWASYQRFPYIEIRHTYKTMWKVVEIGSFKDDTVKFMFVTDKDRNGPIPASFGLTLGDGTVRKINLAGTSSSLKFVTVVNLATWNDCAL